MKNGTNHFHHTVDRRIGHSCGFLSGRQINKQVTGDLIQESATKELIGPPKMADIV
jgi:hypothetical protein